MESLSSPQKKKMKIEKEKLKIYIDETLFIRNLEISDISEDYVKWMNDYDITKFTEQNYFKHNHQSVSNFVYSKYESRDDILFGIFFKNKHIGNIKLGPILWVHKRAEVSFIIGDKSAWGKGIATKAIEAVVQYAFETLKIEKINAGYYEDNTGSANALRKNGFKIEGIKEKDVIFENRRVNTVFVGKISPYLK